MTKGASGADRKKLGTRGGGVTAQNSAAAGTSDTNQDMFSVLPADGIRLPFFLEAETSERRRFLGGSQLRQSN
jgi:hypothetical protein